MQGGDGRILGSKQAETGDWRFGDTVKLRNGPPRSFLPRVAWALVGSLTLSLLPKFNIHPITSHVMHTRTDTQSS